MIFELACVGFLLIFGYPLCCGLVQTCREHDEYKRKLIVYRDNGGKPYVHPHVAISGIPWENKSAYFPDPKEWEVQDKINRKAREAAGL